ADHVTARGNSSRDTSCGMNDALADHKNVRAMPDANRQQYTQNTFACESEIAANPSEVAVSSACIARITDLRLRVSATCPAGSVIRTIGMNCVSPTSPS